MKVFLGDDLVVGFDQILNETPCFRSELQKTIDLGVDLFEITDMQPHIQWKFIADSKIKRLSGQLVPVRLQVPHFPKF